MRPDSISGRLLQSDILSDCSIYYLIGYYEKVLMIDIKNKTYFSENRQKRYFKLLSYVE